MGDPVCVIGMEDCFQECGLGFVPLAFLAPNLAQISFLDYLKA